MHKRWSLVDHLFLAGLGILLMVGLRSMWDRKDIDYFTATKTKTGVRGLIDFIEEKLPNTWSLDEVIAATDFYKANDEEFGNKSDFPVAGELMKSLCESSGPVFVLVCGVNEGQSTTVLLESCPSALVHGFEIQRREFDIATARFQGQANVIIHHAGVSEKQGALSISGDGEGAGLYEPVARWKDAKRQGTVDVTTPSLIIERYSIPRVGYFVIDVEGHEQEVIKGMDLETNSPRFPLFQYELGGTWADSRRAGPWTQFSTALYLQTLGYDIFLMGSIAGNPVLLRTPPEFYRLSKVHYEGFTNGGQKYFVQGNALAVNFEFISVTVKDLIERLTVKVDLR